MNVISDGLLVLFMRILFLTDYIVSWLHLFQNVCTSKVNIILVGTHADGYSETVCDCEVNEI